MDLENLVRTTLSQQGYELVALEMVGRPRVLRVFMDKADGITVDDCAAMSHLLGRVFEVEAVDYDRLEVSSPGLDRPLRTRQDFERFLGAKAAIELRVPLNGRKRFTGVLRGLESDRLALEVDGTMMSLSLGDIDKARLVSAL